jgi:hypothetical protein
MRNNIWPGMNLESEILNLLWYSNNYPIRNIKCGGYG